MSVLKRNRSESHLEFYHTATIIRSDLTRFVMNEKIVPKRWRPIFTFPMIERVNRLMDNITAANTIYPQNLREAEIRRDYQTAVAYPSYLDHFIKELMRVRFYGRYMDDGMMDICCSR